MQKLLPMLCLLPVVASGQHFKLNPRTATTPMPIPVRVKLAAQADTPVAAVYVSTAQGINGFTVSPNGTLTPIPGGPFPVTGTLVGATTTDLITLDAVNIYDYGINADGSPGSSISTSTRNFSGSECGQTAGATLDKRGFLYVNLAGATDAGGNAICDAIQSYRLGQGGLAFVGSADYDTNQFAVASTLPVLGGGWGYTTTEIGEACEQEFNAFARESSGALDRANLSEVDPQPDPMGGAFFPLMAASDGGTQLAVAMVQDYAPPCGPMGGIQIATYSIGPDGAITSTNNYQTMPTTGGADVGAMGFDPTGTMLAVGSGGLTVYQIQGGAPATALTQNLLPGGAVGSVAWDNTSHLYAWGIDADGNFGVFTFNVADGAVTAAGSPTEVPNSTAMVVVPRL